MALSNFLSSLSSGISSFLAPPQAGQTDYLGSLAKVLGGVHGQQQANRAVNTYNVPTPAETQSNALYAAIADPNNPLRQQLAATNQAQNLAGFQSQLNEMQLAQRRNASMGRGGAFFNPERADETMSYLTSRGLPQLNAMSQQQAIDQITNAAKGISGTIQPQVARNTIGMQQGVSNSAYGSQIPDQILNILRGIGGNQSNGGSVNNQVPVINGIGGPIKPNYNSMVFK